MNESRITHCGWQAEWGIVLRWCAVVVELQASNPPTDPQSATGNNHHVTTGSINTPGLGSLSDLIKNAHNAFMVICYCNPFAEWARESELEMETGWYFCFGSCSQGLHALIFK